MRTTAPAGRRTTWLTRALIAWTLVLGVVAVPAVSRPVQAHATSPPGQSLRAQYHLTPPGAWLSDPQRPVYANGKYNLYYLFSNDSNTGQGGWEHATTTDNVVFTDAGTAIPYATNFPVWTGSAVVDTANTAGFGANAVVTLATQPTNGDRYRQEQYLWYSTDGGTHFTAYGAPVISNPNPGNDDWFRDPKISWDPAHSTWVAVVGEDHALAFYTSANLKVWTHQSEWSYSVPDIGGLECPDLFQITADDGTSHWVLAGSFQGDRNGLPDTYGYWTGSWDGQHFTVDTAAPQWLDWGWDWYAAVTWPDQANPASSRFAVGWMDNWRYASLTQSPTYASDGYTGQMSVTRKIRLARQPGGFYSLLSQPVPELDNHVTRTVHPPDATVNGSLDLDYHGSAYELDTDVSWQQLTNVGLSVGMSDDRSRYTNVGVWQGNRLYLDRSQSDQPGQSPDLSFGPYQHAETAYGPANSAHLRIFVDRSSVEVFTTDGKQVLSSLAYFKPGDTGISLYADGGSAQFSNMTIKEFENVTTAAARAAPYAAFDGANYGPWSVTGTAFGGGPATGTLANQQAVSGFQGTGLVNSYLSGDGTTGTLSSPGFAITKPFVNFLVGGGRHPRPTDLFADFEGTGWGSGWGATGSFAGQGPTAASQPNQVGAKVLDTFVNGGDAATGTISSPQFTITRDYIDFLLGGGNHPWTAAGATAVNLLVDGTLRRTATGADSGTLTPVSWDVHDLVGHTAQLQVVDNATGAWGHLLLDQILFADTPGGTYGDPDRQTTVNLVVGGQDVRTATGQDSEHLTWTSWNVAGLIGQTASIRIVDNNTSGWGHVLADAISIDDRPAA